MRYSGRRTVRVGFRRGQGNDVRELLDSHHQELTMKKLIEIPEQEQDIEELDSLDPVQSEDQVTIGRRHQFN
ncbi:hypothetical protein TNCV_4696381 [Trichonephila clavipes]|nr:hypothetical protein TNCV_4696381 [Trichonephila clavipes]